MRNNKGDCGCGTPWHRQTMLVWSDHVGVLLMVTPISLKNQPVQPDCLQHLSLGCRGGTSQLLVAAGVVLLPVAVDGCSLLERGSLLCFVLQTVLIA